MKNDSENVEEGWRVGESESVGESGRVCKTKIVAMVRKIGNKLFHLYFFKNMLLFFLNINLKYKI